MTMRTIAVVSVILTIFFTRLRAAPLGHANSKQQEELYDQGLYYNDANVIRLNATNFRNNIYGVNHTWIVEFYNTWCGACQRFAPVWKQLAADILGWRDIIKVAALDCAAEVNVQFCRDFEIKYYPQIRFFPAGSEEGNMGEEIKKSSTEVGIRHSVVDVLKKEQLSGRGDNWPNITPYRGDGTEDLWTNASDSVKYVVLIFEEEGSYIATEVILDLHTVQDLHIRRVLNDNEALVKLLDINYFPSIVVLERNNNKIPLDIDDTSRESFGEFVKSFLGSKNNAVGQNDLVSEHTHIVDREPEKRRGVTKSQDDILFQVDLENAIKYSLKREISLKKHIEGESLDALKKYLNVLANYFPIGTKGTLFFERLRDQVFDMDTLTGESFLEIVQTLEDELHPVFLGSEDWLGCRGSESRYRGYPCGLWTTFHTLTTIAAVENNDNKEYNGLEVLDAMLGYIKHFFGCQDCSKHFQEMAYASMYGNVTGPNDGILWLWRAHNEVNKRLAGDLTEDPQHPKIQFPSKESCSNCRSNDDDSWIESNVLTHLKHMYNKKHINYTDWNVVTTVKGSVDHFQAELSGGNIGVFESLPLLLISDFLIMVFLF